MITMNKQIIEHALDRLNDMIGCGETDRDEIHFRLFNEDYFIIGRYKAEQFLRDTEEGIFGAINLIKEYEQSNLGEVNTDFSEAEHVANMYTYIKGEELFYECDLYNYPEKMEDKHLKKLINKLEGFLT